MTVKELHDLLGRLAAEGLGDAAVVMSIDPEGNGFRRLERSSGAWCLGRVVGESVVDFIPMDDGSGGHNFVPSVSPNAVCLWPE